MSYKAPENAIEDSIEIEPYGPYHYAVADSTKGGALGWITDESGNPINTNSRCFEDRMTAHNVMMASINYQVRIRSGK